MNERVFNQEIDKLRTTERYERLEVDTVINHIFNSNPVKSIVDIGTGSGLFAEAFFNHNVKVTGVDINPEMINAAKAILPGIEFYLAPAESLPFEDKSFDAAFFSLVLHEADDHLKALKEARRVARNSVWILEAYYRSEESGPPLEHRLTEDFVRKIANEAGFNNFEIIPLTNLVLYKLTD